uniref:Uncharacterized protein n=1 Tax=Escherichia coli TaxID=562 RepID=A0A2R4LAQ7_ECOLX|nr:hypothetical protein pEC36-NDM-5_001 [Escherichia coli]
MHTVQGEIFMALKLNPRTSMNLSNQQQTQKPRVLSPALPERL